MQLTSLAINLAEKGLVPDSVIRQGIRRLSQTRLDEISANNCEMGAQIESDFIAAMNKAPIALVPELANAQHYEVPAKFFQLCLGQHRKYSSCFWLPDTKNLEEAEAYALQLSCEHADLKDGQQIFTIHVFGFFMPRILATGTINYFHSLKDRRHLFSEFIPECEI